MDRKIILIVFALLLILSGCIPGSDQGKQKKEITDSNDQDQQKKQVEITPKVKTTKKYYRTVAGFEKGPARGNITYGVDNRLDIDELESGLMRHSQSAFSPDDYIFQKGQYLSSDRIETWLKHKNMNKHTVNGKKVPLNPEGLNPKLPKGWGDNWEKNVSKKKQEKFFKNNPSYLSYITEQNYLKETDEDKLQLGGISIAISMNKVFSYNVKDAEGTVPLDDKKRVKKAKEVAESILKYIRKKEDVPNVPVVFALYEEEKADAIVPGHFFAKTEVKGNKKTIGDWDTINESHAFFPSKEAEDNHKDDADRFARFKSDIEEYFPNFVGVIGKAFYKEGDLQNLTVKIPVKFYGKSEMISFAQYISGLIDEKNFPFPPEIPVDVDISSSEGPEALVVRKPDMDEPFVHIYKH